MKENSATEEAAKTKKGIIIAVSIAAAITAAVITLITVVIPRQKLRMAKEMLESGDYENAYALLKELGNYDVITASKNERATEMLADGNYDVAYALYEEIGNNDAIAASKYDRAVSMIDSGDYEAALVLFGELGYKDSSSRYAEVMSLLAQTESTKTKGINIGEEIRFGHYEQDNVESNGKEEIEWVVLAVDGTNAMVISKYALDRQPYDDALPNKQDVTWETSSIRKWLNSMFLNTAFSAEEQEMVLEVTVTADQNPMFESRGEKSTVGETPGNPGNDVKDKVFLLSIMEANEYFVSDTARQCKPTAYAIASGAYLDSTNDCCWWWLRTPGYSNTKAVDVRSSGTVRYFGHNVSSGSNCIRPVVWIDLNFLNH